jgi:hypothetical protein
MQFKGLNKKFKSIVLRDGDILFSQGDKTGDGYIIQYGNIQLKTSDKMPSKLPVQDQVKYLECGKCYLRMKNVFSQQLP